MNERIRELVKQATTIEEHKWGVRYDNFNKEKFAELIVRECANLCDRYQDIPATEPRHCAQDIRSLFGVE